MNKTDVTIPASLRWHVQRFDQLSARALYRLLAARINVFVVEQQCPYPELDGKDQLALHVSVLDTTGPDTQLLAYARILPPGQNQKKAIIGRVLTTQAGRGMQLGRAVMRRAMDVVGQQFGDIGIQISAQRYLEHFYQSLGFETITEPYLEDGIEHIGMLYAPD